MIDRTGREAWLDGLKGFGILLVILGHVLSGYLDAYTFPEAYLSFYNVRTWIYSFHMPLFFLISGYTFALAYWRENKLRWKGYGRQVFNLLWIYVLFALVQWVVKQVVPDMVNEPYDLEDLRRMFVEPLGNFWYIYVLLVFYLLGAVTRVVNWQPYWLLLPGALAVMAAELHLDWTELTLYRILYHFFFFTLGTLLYRRPGYLAHSKLVGLSAMVLSGAAYFYFFWNIRSWYANWKLLIALSTSYLFLALFYRWGMLSRIKLLQVCGRHCLELYLLHTFFTAGLRSFLPTLGLNSPWCSVWVNFVASTAICLGLAWMASRCRWTDLIFRPARFMERLYRLRQK